MFQAYKMKFRGSVPFTQPHTKAYTYKNCSILVTKGDSMTISICPHYDLPFPDEEETNEILSYLGMDPYSPYSFYIVQHPDVQRGDTRYFVQPPEKKALCS